MKKLAPKLKSLINETFGSQLPMRIRFFNLCTLGGTLGAALATICPLITGVYSKLGILFCILTILFFFSLFIANYLTKKYDRCILAGVLGLNFIIYPSLYITMGGIDGGMSLYFIMGIVFSLLLLPLKQSIIVFPLEIVMYVAMFFIGETYPGLFFDIPLLEERHIADTAGDFFIVSLTTFCVIKILYSAYEKQLKHSEDLLKQLEEISITDPLTKVYNRRYLVQNIETEILKSKRENIPLSIIMFDIDKFKHVNDCYGHIIGDEVLKSFAQVLKNSCRGYDIVARYGGEEFIILLPLAESETAYTRAEEIRTLIERTLMSSNQELYVTVSGGVAQYDSSVHNSVEAFINDADKYLYEAKETGRNKIVWFNNSKCI